MLAARRVLSWDWLLGRQACLRLPDSPAIEHFRRAARLASTDVVEIRSDARCGVVVWAGVAIGPVG